MSFYDIFRKKLKGDSVNMSLYRAVQSLKN